MTYIYVLKTKRRRSDQSYDKRPLQQQKCQKRKVTTQKVHIESWRTAEYFCRSVMIAYTATQNHNLLRFEKHSHRSCTADKLKLLNAVHGRLDNLTSILCYAIQSKRRLRIWYNLQNG